MANSVNSTFLSIDDVAQRQLCTGCGVCAFMEPNRFRMVDVLEYGRRPRVRDNAPAETGKALKACPGVYLEHTFDSYHADFIRDLTDAWGPVIEVWEGFAIDDKIRFAGSSGGAATALALYSIEKGGMSGVFDHFHSLGHYPRKVWNQRTPYRDSEDSVLLRAKS